MTTLSQFDTRAQADIVLDAEFQSLIPPLSADEYAALETSLLAEGCRDALVVWRGEHILVDGHNRYALCQQHDLQFAVTYKEFDCREAAIVWIIENQLARRNLTEPARIEYALRLKPAIAAMNEARMKAGVKQYPVPNLEQGVNKTLHDLAQKAGVSNGKMHEAESVLTQTAAPYLADLYRAGDITAHRGYELLKRLKDAAPRVKAICELCQETNVEKVDILLRLYRNKSESFEEIETTGFIQPGDEHEAVNWRACSAVQAQKALDLKAKIKAKEAVILRQQQKREEMAAAGVDAELPDTLTLVHDDFRTALLALPENSVDLIFTDPPYDTESIPLYSDLAAHAARVLKPGGSLIAYAGHYALPRVLTDMSRHLRYWWLLAVEHGGGNSVMFHQGVYVKWKPLVWFVKDERADNAYLHDLVHSTPEGNKDLHDWQQGIAEARYYIENLTVPGALVVDPFAGSGTTLVAALELGRRALGVEKNSDHLAVARGRLYATVS